MGRIIGCGHIKIAIPALHVKFRVYDGNMALPVERQVMIGKVIFFDSDLEQRGKGLYIVAGREFLIEALMLNIGIT